MQTVLLVIHLMIAVALIGTILLQRSEGGALGIGGGGGGGFMSGRGTANALTRLTAMLAAGFFVTCILLTLIARFDHPTRSLIDTINQSPASVPAPATTPNPATGTTSGAGSTAPATDATNQGTHKFQDLQPIIPPTTEPAAQTPAPAADATSAKPKLPDLQPIVPPAADAAPAAPDASKTQSKLPDLAPILPADPGTPAKQ